MKTTATTYTLLVTVHHEAGKPPTLAALAAQVTQGLEEGTREHAGQIAASVDAFPGDVTAARAHLREEIYRARRLHDDLRATP